MALRNAYTVPRGFGGKENTERGTRHHRHHAEDHDDEQGRGPTRRDGRHQRLRGHPQGFEPGHDDIRNLFGRCLGCLRSLFGVVYNLGGFGLRSSSSCFARGGGARLG